MLPMFPEAWSREYVEKQATLSDKKAKRDASRLPSWAPLALAGGLGAGAYLFARTPFKADPRKYPVLRKIQDMAKGNMSRSGLGYNARAGTMEKLRRAMLYGPEEASTSQNLMKARRKANVSSPEAVWSGYTKDLPEGVFDPSLGPVTGAQASKNYNLAENVLEDKLTQARFLSKHAPGTYGRTENMKDLLKRYKLKFRPGTAHEEEDLRQIQEALNKEFGTGWVMKTRKMRQGGDFGSSSGGVFPMNQHDLTEDYRNWKAMREGYLADQKKYFDTGRAPAKWDQYNAQPGYRGRVMDEIQHNNVVVQEKLPLEHYDAETAAKLKDKGYATNKEYRVHVVGGKVIPELSYARNNPHKTFSLDEVQAARDAAAWAQKEIDRFPNRYKQLAYGLDVAKLKGPAKYKFMELNPGGQSGFLDIPYHSGHMLHRVTTGRSTVPHAAALGVGTGAVAGLSAIPFSGNQK